MTQPPTVAAFELATFRHPDPALAGRRGVVMGFAVRHDGGVLLVDTGFGFGDAELDARYDIRARRIDEAMRDVGIHRDDVTGLVNCHLHADHAGQNAAFPGVPTVVQATEWALRLTPDHTIRAWVDYPGVTIRTIHGDIDYAPGIRILATPGHTAGHQSMAIETRDGVVVLAGQACYSVDEWAGRETDLEGRSSAWDQAAYDHSIARLRTLRPARVLFGHDRDAWEPPEAGRVGTPATLPGPC